MSMRVLCSVLSVAVLAAPALASDVIVTITGTVEFNQINAPPLGDVNSGDPANLTFKVNSADFVDSMNFPTRGYVIDQDSFELQLGSETIGLQNPFPMGETPYFVLRDNDPAVDGFFTSTSIDFPVGVPIDQTGIFEQFRNQYSVTYTGDTLDSLDILDALGTYDFTNLTVFNWSILDGPFKPMFILFEQMTIAEAPECFLVVGDGPGLGTFDPGLHQWEVQVGEVQQHFAVLMEDIPEFVLATPETLVAGAFGGGTTETAPEGPVIEPGLFAVQVVMWNPTVFPGLPEQYTYGLMGYLSPGGVVRVRPFGNGTGMEIWHELGVNEQGQPTVRFPFSIPGF